MVPLLTVVDTVIVDGSGKRTHPAGSPMPLGAEGGSRGGFAQPTWDPGGS